MRELALNSELGNPACSEGFAAPDDFQREVHRAARPPPDPAKRPAHARSSRAVRWTCSRSVSAPGTNSPLTSWKVACAVGLVSIRKSSAVEIPASENYANWPSATPCNSRTSCATSSEDLSNGCRIYLPLEDLSRFEYSETRPCIARVHDDRFLALMAYETERAEALYREAEENLAAGDRQRLLPARIMAGIYQTLLNQMKADGFRVFQNATAFPKPASWRSSPGCSSAGLDFLEFIQPHHRPMRMTPSRAASYLGAPICLLLTVSCYYEPYPEPRPRTPGQMPQAYGNQAPNDGRYGPVTPDSQGVPDPYGQRPAEQTVDPIPVARRTENPNRIISPFPPYNVVDVTGFIKHRSFSLLLARRYLNPRRAVLSSFTLISLVGVLLGVLVLVVVMAVYAGLERDVKGRLLGFTPHILLRHHSSAFGDAPMKDWQQVAQRAAKLPRVEAATAFVSDNVIIDVESWQRPVMFRGIDTSDPAQVRGVAEMLDLENHPESTADFGIDDRAVVSSIVADQLGLQVGSVIRLYSTRNFEEVMRVYKATENPPLREAFAEATPMRRIAGGGWRRASIARPGVGADDVERAIQYRAFLRC
jgi:hypothetical protein